LHVLINSYVNVKNILYGTVMILYICVWKR